ncbi:uncharacterized protein [Palaemon carinicauda]|uniref:uncharacterized protein n=1 Tax=Palaemon carinicauda TaxID=392227 RepID=UPI0035B62D72
MALKLVIIVALAALAVEAKPRYIAIPLQDIRLVRHARSAPSYIAIPQGPVRQERFAGVPYKQSRPQSSERVPVYAQPQSAIYEEGEVLLPDGSDRYERQAGHGDGYGGGNDHVDYGAYTGGYGAFGWYSDHPVCINCGYHRR